MGDWHQDWFNQDYINLYAHRDEGEAEEHFAFLQRHTGLKKGRVLDLGCGMGRHCIAFARHGFDVVGVDASEVLLEEAKERAQGLPIDWIHQDFRDLPQLGLFDLVLSMFTSFGYFDSDEANATILEIAAQHLKPQAFFFLDFLNPAHVMNSLVPEEESDVNGESIHITRSIERGQVIKTIAFQDRFYTERVKLYEKDHIISMAAEKGLNLCAFWTGYQPQSADRQLFLFIPN